MIKRIRNNDDDIEKKMDENYEKLRKLDALHDEASYIIGGMELNIIINHCALSMMAGGILLSFLNLQIGIMVSILGLGLQLGSITNTFYRKKMIEQIIEKSFNVVHGGIENDT